MEVSNAKIAWSIETKWSNSWKTGNKWIITDLLLSTIKWVTLIPLSPVHISPSASSYLHGRCRRPLGGRSQKEHRWLHRCTRQGWDLLWPRWPYQTGHRMVHFYWCSCLSGQYNRTDWQALKWTHAQTGHPREEQGESAISRCTIAISVWIFVQHKDSKYNIFNHTWLSL